MNSLVYVLAGVLAAAAAVVGFEAPSLAVHVGVVLVDVVLASRLVHRVCRAYKAR